MIDFSNYIDEIDEEVKKLKLDAKGIINQNSDSIGIKNYASIIWINIILFDQVMRQKSVLESKNSHLQIYF